MRTEDNAVDIQIHRGAPRVISTQTHMAEEISLTDDSVESNDKPESTIPKELRKNAIKVQVTGLFAGEYALVPYNGKLRKYTDKSVISMFIPQTRAGKEKNGLSLFLLSQKTKSSIYLRIVIKHMRKP